VSECSRLLSACRDTQGGGVVCCAKLGCIASLWQVLEFGLFIVETNIGIEERSIFMGNLEPS
jgi:hypothetical protein